MSDEIKGLAILDDRGTRLMLFATGVCEPGSGREPQLVMIPLRERGTAPGATVEWEYDIAGDMIHVTPSVAISTNRPIVGREEEYPAVAEPIALFHNGGEWSVRYVRWSVAPDKLPDDHPWEYWRRVNFDLLK